MSSQGSTPVPITTMGSAPATGGGTTGTTSMQSQSTQIHYKIPILEDADGFMHWHFCMKLALHNNDFLSVVNGTFMKPNITADLDVYIDWVSKDLKAQLQIATTLCKEALNIILQATSAKDCWNCLTARYQGRGNHCITYLM